LFKSVFTNSFGILVSRIFGFGRDLMMASVLGANIYSDIFFIAFKLPNLFRRIFAEGAFTQSFLPSFAKTSQKSIFAVSIMVRFLIFLIFFSLLVTFFSEFFTKMIALGFSDEVIKESAIFVAINFYYLILIFLVTFLASLLQYKNHFATTAFSTALLNIALICALTISQGSEPKIIVYYLSYGVLVGGVMQLFSHIIAIKVLKIDKIIFGGLKYINKKSHIIKKDLKKFNNSFAHAILGNSTAQISAFFDTILASFLVTGSISYLYYANRIFQLPLALFAIAISVAIFPKISRYLNNKNEKKAREMLKKSFWFLTFLLTIATIGGIILSQEIIWLLFERGEFSATDTQNSALVLQMYMVGLLPFGLSKIFSLWLYATHKQKTAAKIALKSLTLNIIFSLTLILPFQASGLALASSLTGSVLLYFTIKEFGKKEFFAIIRDKLILYLFLTIFLEIGVLIFLKDLINVYLR